MGQPVVHFEVYGKEPDQLGKFYGELFGWNVQTMPDMNYTMVRTEAGKGIDGGIMAAPQGQSNGLTFYIEVDDLRKYLERIEKAGGKTIVPPTDIPKVVSFALFQDPQGNVVGLVASAIPE